MTDSPTSAPTTPARVTGRTAARDHLLPMVLLVLLAHILVLGTASTLHQISPIDEAAHYDYILRFPDVPVTGDRMTQETLELWACRGIALPNVVMPSCDTNTHDPDQFPGLAYNLAGTHPPLYYGVTAGVARALAELGDLPLFTAARAVGVLWFSLLLVGAYLLALRIGASRMAAFGAAALLAASPALVTAASTLGPDVAGAAVGAFLMLAAIRFDGSGRSALPVLLLAVLAGLTKLTLFTAVGVVALYLVIHPLIDGDRRRTIGKGLLLATTTVVLFLGISFAWTSLSSARATMDSASIPQNTWFLTESLDLRMIPAHVFTFLTPINDGWIAPQFEGLIKYRLESYVTGALVLGVVAAAWYLRSRPMPGTLGSAVLIFAAIGAPVLLVMNFLVYGMYFQIPPRYGYALLAGFAAAAAFAFRDRQASRALVVVATITALAVIVQSEPFNVMSI